jgi:hypothetical protein
MSHRTPAALAYSKPEIEIEFHIQHGGALIMRRALLPALAGLVTLSFLLPAHAQKNPPAIQDNSFLVEEAYNQEKGVVQHISTFAYYAASRDWSYAFTQEWPVGGLRNQLSYTLSSVRPGAFASHGPGMGDALINYRYQVLGSGDTRVAFAPRFSLILPSGNSGFGRGYGGTGAQSNLPLSLVLLPKLVSHWNAGTTFVPHARNDRGDRAAIWSYNAGQSFIWLARPRFNVMLETYYVNSQTVATPGKAAWSQALFLNPGIRWAYNFCNRLQIVPGLAVPIGVGPSAGEKGVFVYLSFEHPFSSTH